jgi:hypothetical protein
MLDALMTKGLCPLVIINNRSPGEKKKPKEVYKPACPFGSIPKLTGRIVVYRVTSSDHRRAQTKTTPITKTNATGQFVLLNSIKKKRVKIVF